MYEVVDFSAWLEYHGSLEGSGRSEKIWIVSPDDQKKIGLFKYPKSEFTTEHVSEHLAHLLAEEIGIRSAKIDLGIRHGRLGSMSYLINRPEETIVEGLSYICGKYKDYDKDRLHSESNQAYYSINMISETMKRAFKKKNDFDLFMRYLHKTMLFDAIIGNRDRHHSNWALLVRRREGSPDDAIKYVARFAPLYDNGSSLCCYDSEEKLYKYFGADQIPFKAMLTTKSRSCIRLDGKRSDLPTHDEVVKYLAANYKNELADFVRNMNQRLTETKITDILSGYTEEILSEQRKKLIQKFVLAKVRSVSEAFGV